MVVSTITERRHVKVAKIIFVLLCSKVLFKSFCYEMPTNTFFFKLLIKCFMYVSC